MSTLPKLPLLFNPRAGSGSMDPEVLLRGLPVEHGERIEPLPLGPPWDFAPAIAQAEAAGGPLLVWGGDGTLHHAAKALLAAGCPVPLAAVPGGSGNGLVRGLRTPLEPAGAVQRLLEGRELALDVGRLDGEPFFNLCGTGFEAVIAGDFEGAGHRGFLGYARHCARLWRRHQAVGLRWDALRPSTLEPTDSLARLRAAWKGPEPEFPDRAWSLCFANLPQYGMGLWIAPGADPRDGILQWATLERPSFMDLIAELPGLFKENGRSALRAEGRLTRAILFLDRPLPWHMDGEVQPARDRAELWVERQAFRMQVTEACPWR
jgi:diacylglycerol kinase family enzyme